MSIEDFKKTTLQLPPGFRKGPQVYDVGCGIRPHWGLGKPICVEPNDVYADILEEDGYEVMRMDALQAADELPEKSTILLLDVIEHLERKDGEELIPLLRRFEQVCVFTPLGFMEQEGDAWGLEQHEHQRHKSGWLPDDFPGWDIAVQPGFHRGHGAFFAMLY